MLENKRNLAQDISDKKPVDRDIKKFIKELQNECENIGTRKEMSWPMMVQIKAYLLSSPTSKHAMDLMGINKTTWYRWKREGDEVINSLKDNALSFRDLNDRQKQLITFVHYLSIAKQKQIRKAWLKLQKLSEKDYRALQFELKVLDPETFNIENKMKLSGYLENNSDSEDERISKTLQEFMPKDNVNDLEDGDAQEVD